MLVYTDDGEEMGDFREESYDFSRKDDDLAVRTLI